MTFSVALALAVAPTATAEQQGRQIVFKGGALGGLAMDTVPGADGTTRSRLGPSRPNASPPTPAAAAAVGAYLKAYQPRRERVLRPYLAPGATSRVCQTIGNDACEPQPALNPFPFDEHCVANAPYQVDDGSVRVEWLYEGKLYYVTWLALRDGKIASLSTHRATAPVLMK